MPTTQPDAERVMLARYYNPTTGRFTQPDPSGYEANAYAYAADNPINNIDPTGLLSFVEGAIIGVGAVALGAGLLLAAPGVLVAGTIAYTAVTTVAVLGSIFAFTAGTVCTISGKCG